MRRWTCALGNRVEADSEEDLIVKIQDHMRREHGVEMSWERVERELLDE